MQKEIMPQACTDAPRVTRLQWTIPIVLSALILVPCFWQPIVSCVDLQSHLYNAWLGELIRNGSIHGLWIEHQNTNVAVDIVLSTLFRRFGTSSAERMLCGFLILIFFWGAFRFISAVRGGSAYWITPLLAILSYGFVFQLGLLNFYLSCGIVLWALAMVWNKPIGLDFLWTVPLLAVAYVAHPMPVLWFVGLAIYSWLFRRLPQRMRMPLFTVGVLSVAALRIYVDATHTIQWFPQQLVYWTGADQALLFGGSYVPVALGLIVLSVVLLSRPETRSSLFSSLPGHIYFLTAATIMIVPSTIQAPGNGASAGYVAARLSLLTGVLLLALVSRASYRRWYVGVGLLLSGMFFASLYFDIGEEAHVVAKMEQLISTLPPGARLISYVDPNGGIPHDGPSKTEDRLRQFAKRLTFNRLDPAKDITHLASRACIGRCFDYANYEPPTNQFRIHAAAGNSVVVSRWEDVDDIGLGSYVVEARDIPLYGLLRCGPGSAGVYLRPLQEGELVRGACLGILSAD